MKRFTQGLVAVVLMTVCAIDAAPQGFKGLYIGQLASEVPASLKDALAEYRSGGDGTREGLYKSDWIRVEIVDGKVFLFTVIYSGTPMNSLIEISPNVVTLAQAIKIHSLGSIREQPNFGFAKGDGPIYGIVDIANGIIYTSSNGDVRPDSVITKVEYLHSSAPVFGEAAKLSSNERDTLLKAANAAANVIPLTVVYSEDRYQGSSAKDALTILKRQQDVVIGKGKRTLALIQELMGLYEVDKHNPNAASREHDLRQFYADFHEEDIKMTAIFVLNRNVLDPKHMTLAEMTTNLSLGDACKAMSADIDSKMRRLKAIGFQP